CHRQGPLSAPPQVPSTTTPAARTTREYHLVGLVRDVKKESGQVVIRHEEIPGFMKAMTMPFSVTDPAVFEDLRVGYEVEGRLRFDYDGATIRDYELANLVVSKPALAAAPSLRLSLAGGEPRIGVTPHRLEAGEPVPDFTMSSEDGQSLALAA